MQTICNLICKVSFKKSMKKLKNPHVFQKDERRDLRLDSLRGLVLGGVMARLQEERVGNKEFVSILASCCQ
jgi:hypothetical protein